MPLHERDRTQVDAVFARRVAPLHHLAEHAAEVATACHAMARRFHRGGTLLVFGNGTGCTDAQHVAVEFVHPVIVGKRALPAISLTSDVATLTGIAAHAGYAEVFAHQIRHLGQEPDIALGIADDGDDASVVRGLETARELGMLTVALVGGRGGTIAARRLADHVLLAASADPRVVKEVQVTTYHVLWELVHVFFEQPGVLDEEVTS